MQVQNLPKNRYIIHIRISNVQNFQRYDWSWENISTTLLVKYPVFPSLIGSMKHNIIRKHTKFVIHEACCYKSTDLMADALWRMWTGIALHGGWRSSKVKLIMFDAGCTEPLLKGFPWSDNVPYSVTIRRLILGITGMQSVLSVNHIFSKQCSFSFKVR